MLLQLGTSVVCHLPGWWTSVPSAWCILCFSSHFGGGGIISLHLHFGWSRPRHFGAALQKLMEVLCIYGVGARDGIWLLALSAEVAKALLARFHYELRRQPRFVNRFEKY